VAAEAFPPAQRNTTLSLCSGNTVFSRQIHYRTVSFKPPVAVLAGAELCPSDRQ